MESGEELVSPKGEIIDELKIVNRLIWKTGYISRRSFPQVAHNLITLRFKNILEEMGFKAILEQRQNYYKSKKKVIKGRVDMLAINENKSIAIEYDAGSYWEIRSIRKLSEIRTDFVVLIIGSGSIYNQYRNNIYKRLLKLKNKKGVIASLRLKEIDSIQNLLKFYNLDNIAKLPLKPSR